MVIGPPFASSAKPEELCDVPAHELGQGRDMLWFQGQLSLTALVLQPFHVLVFALSVPVWRITGVYRGGLSRYHTQTRHSVSFVVLGSHSDSAWGRRYPRPELGSCPCFCLYSSSGEFYQ